MKSFILVGLLFFSSLSIATDLRSGDLIFLSLPCYTCRVIEQETQSQYSHVGVVLISPQGQTFVAEAWGKVKFTPLKDYLAKSRKGFSPGYYRVKSFAVSQNSLLRQRLWEDFKTKFEGLDYDGEFLWDDGKLYCSELVAKLLNPYMTDQFDTHPLDFSTHWDFWARYYRGEDNIPQGEIGNSPESLIESGLVHQL